MPQRPTWPDLLRLAGKSVLLAAVFAITGYAAIELARHTANVAALWPSNAIVLAVMLLSPRREWPWYLIAAAVGNVAQHLFLGDNLIVAVAFAACNLLEFIIAAGLLTYLRATEILSSLTRLLSFLIAIAAGTAASATMAAGVVAVAFNSSYWGVWWPWWIADAVGMLILTPALVAQAGQSLRLPLQRLPEAVMLYAALAAASFFLLSGTVWTSQYAIVLDIVAMPFLLWAALRLGMGGATIANLVAAIAAITTLFIGAGPSQVAGASEAEAIVALQAIVAAGAVTALIVAAAMADRQHSEQQLGDAIESLTEGFALFDADDRLVLCNETYKTMHGELARKIEPGISFETIIRASAAADQYPLEDNEVESWIAERLDRHRNPRGPFEHPLRSGRWLQIAEQRTRDGGYVGVRTDITRLKRQEEALREGEEQFRRVVEASPSALVMIDQAGRIALVNGQAEAIFGYKRDELLGQSVEILLPERLRASHPGHRAGFFAAPSVRAMGIGRELYARRKDGSEFPVEIGLNPMTTAEGTMILSAIVDISQRKQAESELKRMAAENLQQRELAEAANRSKSDFLATMSHEIRTPINGVIGYAQMLLDTPLTPDQRSRLGVIQSCGRALMTIVNDILDISRIEAGKLDLETVDFDPVTVAEEMLAIAQKDASDKGLTLAMSVSAGVPRTLRGDPGRLGQIILNLVSNAVKFTERGSINVDLGVEVATATCVTLRISVRDTGIGMTRDIKDRLFEEFFQGDAGRWRRYGGSGLGLAISKRLVALLGGSIGVDSKPGEGSCFWFTAEFACSTDARHSAGPAEKAPLRPARVLLVDDLKINRDLGAGLLASAGHQVDCVEDGAAALAAVTARNYQAVLMDVQMPKMDGLEATARIRSLPEPKCHVPIIAMTAYAAKSDIQSCLTVGMNDHLAKPIDKQRLLDMVDRWAWQDRQVERRVREPTADAEPTHGHEPLDTGLIAVVEQSLGRAETIRLAAMLIERLDSAAVDMRRQAEQGDFAGLQREAHKLVSQAGNMGLARVSALCRELQDDAGCGRLVTVSDMIARVDAIDGAARDAVGRLREFYPECDLSTIAAKTIRPTGAPLTRTYTQ